MSRPRCICLITDSAEPSGVGEHMLTLAAGLGQAHRVTLAAPAGTGLPERAAALGLGAHGIDPPNDEATRRWLSAAAFDLVHVHAGIGWEGHGLAALARRAGTPTIVRTDHLPYLLDDPEQQRLNRDGLALVDALIAVSRSNAATHRDRAGAATPVVAIANGIAPCPPADRARARAKLDLDARPTLLMVARFAEQKGHHLLLDALPAVLAVRPDTRLLLAGDGPLLDAVRERLAAAPWGDAVRLLGCRADVPTLMAAADLLLLPSRFEGLPLVALEAMAAGLPVVATAVVGSVDAVADRQTGWLTPPGDAPALARAIVAALADPARLASMAAEARARFARQFTALRMVNETAALYERLLDEQGASRAA